MTAAAYTTERRVRFSDCDPAGIVFFPQYLVMLNGAIEQWFDESLGVPYAGLVRDRIGLPTVRLECDFTAVSRHGDLLALGLSVLRLGRSSFTLQAAYNCGGELRMRSRQVLVCTSLADHRPRALPDDVRAGLARCLQPEIAS